MSDTGLKSRSILFPTRMPTRYASSLGLGMVLVMAGICAVTCGIYMIERTVGILEIALRYNFPLGSFLGMVVLQLPALAEFALPVATYAAAHFMLLARREGRELVVLAAAGASANALVVPVILVAMVSAAVSLAFTDTVAPAATRAYRAIETSARAQVLAERLPESRFFAGEGAVLYIGHGGESGSTLRLIQKSGGEIVSILSSDCASPHTLGSQIRLRLCGGEAYLFSKPPETGATPARVVLGETIYPFDAAAVLGGRSSSRLPVQSIRELLNGPDSGRAETAEGLSRLLSALACLLGAALAIVTVAVTTAHTRILAFVGGTLAMLALLALRDPLAHLLAGIPLPIALAVGMFIAFAALLLPQLVAMRFIRRLVTPAMVKA